jgi:hypothetical protein
MAARGNTQGLRVVRWTDEQMLTDGWAERIAFFAFTASMIAVFAAGGAAVQWAVMTVFSARMMALLSLGSLAIAIGCWAALFLALVSMRERGGR